MKIATNECYSWIRKRQDNLFSLEQEIIETQTLRFPPAPDEVIVKEELYNRVMSAISELPEKDKKVIELFYLEEKSYQEIQQELGISKSVLGWRLSNARAKLRQKLQAAYHGIAFWRYFKWSRITEFANVKISSMSVVNFFLISLVLHLAVVMIVPKVYHGKSYNQGYGNDQEIELVATTLLPSTAQEPDQLDPYSPLRQRVGLPSNEVKGQSDRRIWATEPEIIATSTGPIEQLSLKSAEISSQWLNNSPRPGLLAPLEPLLPVDDVLIQSQYRSATPTSRDSFLTKIQPFASLKGKLHITEIPFRINQSDSTYSYIPVNDSVSMIAAPPEDTTFPKIVFVSGREHKYLPWIYVMNIDGSEAVPIADFTAKLMGPTEGNIGAVSVHLGGPSVSPTGKQIAFHALFPGKGWNIYVVDIDGKNVTQLTADHINKAALLPAWSLNGEKIAFCLRENYKMDIYVMRTDGSNPVNLTKNQSENYHPAWSPDSTRIAFSSNMEMDPRIRNIYVMGADGKNLKQLTQNRKIGWTSGHPAWSPDGKYIAYDSGKRDRGGNSQSTIFIMDADGKNPRPLITRANRPAWSPDGQKIVFVSNQDGNDEIYMIDVDGKNLKRLTMNRYQDTDPCWIEKP
jgi:TolB protein